MSSQSLHDTLIKCGTKISEWNARNFGNVRKQLKFLKGQLERLSNKVRTDKVIREEARLSKTLDELLAREELLWEQRSCMDWHKEGDKNTTFFKLKATQRRNKKMVNCIRKDYGSMVTELDDITKTFTDYFSALFQKHADEHHIDWDKELDDIML